MPANTTPIFTHTPIHAMASIATANTARDGTGTVGTVYTPGSNGGRVEMVRVVAAGATTAGVVRIFIYDGAAYFLIKELMVSAVTPSVSVEVANYEWVPTVPILLPTGYSLRASTHIAETFKIHVEASDF